MKKVFAVLSAVGLLLFALTAFAGGEGPMQLPSGANASANKHNNEGIAEWNKGNFEGALMHFQMASKIDGAVGESHFNEALCLDKLGEHGAAAMHFKAARANAHGNLNILQSGILNAHAPIKEGS
ncbi:MAG: hypothetical protein ACE5G9_07225 [Nitrospinales bacterium]